MNMHTLCLFTLFTLLVPLSLSQNTTFYIDETSEKSNPDGSISNPFPNLYNAAMQLSTGTFDIILLGQSVTIIDKIIFPPGSICTIKPQTIPKSGHYPLRIVAGASIDIQHSNVTFQDIQFAELDPVGGWYVITVSAGLLFLNRVLVSDILPEDTYDSYRFIYAEKDLVMGAAAISLLDCQFRNLTNVEILTETTQVTIQNTVFDNIEMKWGYFFELNFWYDPNTTFRMSNTSLINSRFVSEGVRFIYGSYVNVSLEDFSAKNISISYGVPLIDMTRYNEQVYTTRINIRDVVLEDIVEIEGIEDRYSTLIGLIFDFSWPAELSVRNLTARNLKFENSSLLRYFSIINEYYPDESSLSQVSLQDIKIENSSNTNFLISFNDKGQVENVELVNEESKRLPVFFFRDSETFSVKNISGKNISGPVLSLNQVFNQSLEDLTFENVSLSPKSSLVSLTRYFDKEHPEPIENVNQPTVIANFFIDGSGYIEAEDQEGKAYLMTIQDEVGTVLIRDSIWKNINTEGLFISHMDALKMENFTVNGAFAQPTSWP